MGVNKKQKKVSIINTLKIDDKGNADRAPRLCGSQGREGFCVDFKALSES